MKNALLTCLIIFSISSCQKKKTEEKVIVNNLKNKNKMNEQPIYTLAISVANPHEVYLNDMPLIKDYNEGSSNFEMPMNDFILKSGQQNLKIVLLPEKGKTMVDKLGIDHVDIKIFRYSSGLSNMSPDKRTIVKVINLKEFNELPILIKVVEFNAIVPYELVGWSKSVDLSKENQEKLKKDVLAKYEELSRILNNGDYDGFLKENKSRDTEVDKCFYYDIDAQKEDEEFLKNRISKSKNNMVELKEYKLVLYGNKKLITMENIRGKSSLCGDNGKTLFTYFILLHRPNPNTSLEIIR